MSKRCVTWLIVILWLSIMAAACWGVYDSAPVESRMVETIKMFLLVLGGFGVVLPTTWNIMNQLEIQKDRVNERTLDLLRGWDDAALIVARSYTRGIGDKKADITENDLKREIKKNADLRQSVILVFNYFDAIRVALKLHLVDEETIKRTIGEAFHKIDKRFKEYIEETSSEKAKQDLEELRKMLK